MIIFWIFAALMMIVALLSLGPLLGRVDDDKKAALRSLRKAFEDGHIDAAQFQQRHAELSADSQEPATPRAGLTAGALSIVLPLAAVALYVQLGTPEALDGKAADPRLAQQVRPAGTQRQAPPPGEAPQLREAIAALAQRLEQQPNDAEGWFLLGRSYIAVEDFEQAVEALEQAFAQRPDDPTIMVELGQALAFAAGPGTFPERTKELVATALARDPQLQRGLWLAGAIYAQEQDYERAIASWEDLLAQLEPETEIAAEVRAQLERLYTQTGQQPPGTNMASSAQTVAEGAIEEGAAATGAGFDVVVRLGEELQNTVSPTDTLFVFARAKDGPPMPLAIQRLTPSAWPVELRLDESMGMLPTLKLSQFPEIQVVARLSSSGTATPQAGDLEAEAVTVPSDYDGLVELTIDRTL